MTNDTTERITRIPGTDYGLSRYALGWALYEWVVPSEEPRAGRKRTDGLPPQPSWRNPVYPTNLRHAAQIIAEKIPQEPELHRLLSSITEAQRALEKTLAEIIERTVQE